MPDLSGQNNRSLRLAPQATTLLSAFGGYVRAHLGVERLDLLIAAHNFLKLQILRPLRLVLVSKSPSHGITYGVSRPSS